MCGLDYVIMLDTHFDTKRHRTTNHLEGWQNKLKKKACHFNPNMFTIRRHPGIHLIQIEAGGIERREVKILGI